jgi:hypothetical protein
VVLNDLVNVLSGHDFVVLFVVGLALKLLDVDVSHGVILPHVSDLLQLDFNLELLTGIVSELVNFLTMVVEAKLKDLLQREFWGVLIELFLNFEL